MARVRVNTTNLHAVSQGISGASATFVEQSKVIETYFENLFSSDVAWAGSDRDACAKQWEDLKKALHVDLKDFQTLASDFAAVDAAYQSLADYLNSLANSQVAIVY